MGQLAEHERVFLQCLPGLEPVLEADARHLGLVLPVAEGVEVEGPTGLHAEAALVLRVPGRVLLPLRGLRGRGWSEVEAALRSTRLDGVATPGAAVALDT